MTTFWKDSWVCEAPPKVMFLLVYDHYSIKNRTAVNYFNFWTNLRKIRSTDNTFSDFQEQLNLLRSLLGFVALSNEEE